MGDRYQINIRFYEELNDFIKNYPEKKDIPFSFSGKRSIKDLIESFGVPHVEVDLILVNSKPVDFDYKVRTGDRISVYPVFERLFIGKISPLKESPLRKNRFVLDVHLGKLARDLRLLGFDCDYATNRDDPELARISSEDHRILLTRDRGLLKRKIVRWGLIIRSDNPEKQVLEVLDKMDLKNEIRPFTRCISCNGSIKKLEINSSGFYELKENIPPGVLKWCRDFSYCPDCGKIYWKGSHYERMMRKIEELVNQ